MRLLVLLLTATMLVTGCESLSKQPSSPQDDVMIDLKDKNNADATKILSNVLQDNGYTVRKVSQDQFIVTYNQHNYILEPKLMKNSLSRIVVSRLFEIKEEYQHSPKLFVLVTSLNRDLNFAKFSILPGNRAGHVQTAITFAHETVSLDEIKQFIAWFDDSLAEVKQMVPREALDMIKHTSRQ